MRHQYHGTAQTPIPFNIILKSIFLTLFVAIMGYQVYFMTFVDQQFNGKKKNGYKQSHPNLNEVASDIIKGRPVKEFYAAHGQDRWIKDVLISNFPNKENWSFVEAGAFDGLTGSNVASLERDYGWRGLCYEPNPDNFELVKSWRPLCHSINGILCDPQLSRQGKQVTYRQLGSPYGQEGGIVDFMGDDKKARLESLKEYVVRDIQLSCHSMSDDVQEFLKASKKGTGHVDLLSLDVEGSEDIVLKTINWKDTQIDIIMVERSHESAVIAYLTGLNYEHVARVGDDNIFFRKDVKKYIDLWKEGCKCWDENETCHHKLVYPDQGWNCQKRPLKAFG